MTTFIPSTDTFLTCFFNETLVKVQSNSNWSLDTQAECFFECVTEKINSLNYTDNLGSKTNFVNQLDFWFHQKFNPLAKINKMNEPSYAFERVLNEKFIIFLSKLSKIILFGDILKKPEVLSYYQNFLKPQVDKMVPYINESEYLKNFYDQNFLSIYRQVPMTKNLLEYFLKDTTNPAHIKNLYFLKETVSQVCSEEETAHLKSQLKLLLAAYEEKIQLSASQEKETLKSVIHFIVGLEKLEVCNLTNFLKNLVKDYFSFFYKTDLPSIVHLSQTSQPSPLLIENSINFVAGSSIIDFLAFLPPSHPPKSKDLELMHMFIKNKSLRAKVISFFPTRGLNYIEFIHKGSPANREKKLVSFFNGIRLGFFEPAELLDNIKKSDDYYFSVSDAAQEFKKIVAYLKTQKRKDEQIDTTIMMFDSFADKMLLQSTISEAILPTKPLKI